MAVAGRARNGAASRVAAALAVAAVLLAGCTANGSGASTRPPTTASGLTTPSQSPTPTAESVVLATYTAFWKALPEASRLSGAPRTAVLTQYLVNPALSKISGTLAAQDAFHKALYGENVPRPTVVRMDGSSADVRDCQDSSRAGVEDLKTLQKLNVGVPRNLVMSTLLRSPDGQWRISTIVYPGGQC